METGAVHSEPVIDSPRLFFSVLPGTEKEIKEYQLRLHHQQHII